MTHCKRKIRNKTQRKYIKQKQRLKKESMSMMKQA